MKPIPGTDHFAGEDGHIYSRMGRGVTRAKGRNRWRAVVFLGGGALDYAYFRDEGEADAWVAKRRAELGQDGWRRLGNKTDRGYVRTSLRVDGRYKQVKAHRMIAMAWRGPPPPGKNEVRHLNGVRDDNRPENLAWGSRGENMDDRAVHRGETRRTSP